MGRRRRRGGQAEPAAAHVSEGRPGIPRSEWSVLAVLIAIAAATRFAVPGHMSVEHFDEGVYASNLWFGAENGYQYPDRHLFAPPLLPALIEWAMILFGQHAMVPMLVNLIAGTLTVALIWWTARRWFGPVAAAVAGLLCATSDVHILYSRTALTDPLLDFWLLLAVYLFSEYLFRADWRWAIAAGVATGLAGWTKYSGWLPLAITLSGALPWLLLSGHRDRLRTVITHWLVMLFMAAVVWSPVWWSLQAPGVGGYSAVSANHRQYVVGPGGWWDSLTDQIGYLNFIDGPLSTTGLLVGWLLPSILLLFGQLPRREDTSSSDNPGGSRSSSEPDTDPSDATADLHQSPAAGESDTLMDSHGPSSRSHRPHSLGGVIAIVIAGAAILLAVAAAGGSTPALAIASLAGLLMQIRRPQCCSDSDDGKSRAQAGAWLTLAWWCGLALATPMYTPYPRLTLPWLIAAWLGTGAAVGWITEYAHHICHANGKSPRRRPLLITAVAALLVALFVAPVVQPFHAVPWQDCTSLADAAINLAADALNDSTRRPGSSSGLAVYVFAEPAAFFHLSAEGLLAGPISDLDFAAPTADPLPVATYLVVGPHAGRTAGFNEEFARYASRFEKIAAYPFQASDLTLSNELSPAELIERSNSPSPHPQELILYRLR